jgi:hypothetical protein
MAYEHKVWLICDNCNRKQETTNAGSYNIDGWSHISIDGWTDTTPFSVDKRTQEKFIFCITCNQKEPNWKKLLVDKLFKG